MKEKLFNEKTKLADLIAANYNLILMLPRFGLPLGFGDKKVKDICAEYKVPSDFFLMVCNVYTFDGYIPTDEEIVATDMSLLTPYLLASHQHYLRYKLPHIEQHLSRIADDAGERYGTALKSFFAEYKNDISQHFEYEEKIVFPYMTALQDKREHETYCISNFKKSHSNIEDKLDDLTKIIFKYLPGNILPEESIDLIFDIIQLLSDLTKHSAIEEKILVPYVTSLEREAL
ncbi:MAG: hemerythrin domain-containing protein [Bacteroidales bacterium]|nr:hemerythrin domain-containing protein [Bacteroidales bacterium]